VSSGSGGLPTRRADATDDGACGPDVGASQARGIARQQPFVGCQSRGQPSREPEAGGFTSSLAGRLGSALTEPSRCR